MIKKEREKALPADGNRGNPKNRGENENADENQSPNWPLVFLRDTFAGNPGRITASIDNDFHDRGN